MVQKLDRPEFTPVHGKLAIRMTTPSGVLRPKRAQALND
jgi:hypothetical protein